MKLLYIAIITLFAQGCTIGHKAFYEQSAPITYPATHDVKIFEYANVELSEIYSLLFSDFLVLGQSGYNGPYQSPTLSSSFAMSIGADVFIATSQFTESKTRFVTLSMPTSNTSYVSGYSGTGSFYGTATTWGTRTTMIPVSENAYNQFGMFLRNVNGIVPLWGRTDSQYKKTTASEIEGVWFNDKYTLSLYRSGEQYVAFIRESNQPAEIWRKGDLKFIFGTETNVGIYLMGDKTPMPAQFTLNKFGHLEVLLTINKERFSFARHE